MGTGTAERPKKGQAAAVYRLGPSAFSVPLPVPVPEFFPCLSRPAGRTSQPVELDRVVVEQLLLLVLRPVLHHGL